MSLKIGKYIIKHPIVQGGMGVGVSWNNLAGAVSLAGGLWSKEDIDKFIKLGADGVQLGTRFALIYESDVDDNFKKVLLKAGKEDIK